MLNTRVPGIELKISGQTLIVRSHRELRILSSSVLNGGLTRSRFIINHHVPKNSHSRNPERYLRQILREKNLDQNTVGLMTAAEMNNAIVINMNDTGFPISTVVTAGTSNALAAGDRVRHLHLKNGTINMIILLDANPTDACLVEIVKTATEAKSLALMEMDILSRISNKTATGTSTDTITVAATDRGKPIKYAGTATVLGSSISRSVTKAVKEAIRKQDGISSTRISAVRLQERGITPEKTAQEVLQRLRKISKKKLKKHILAQLKTLTEKTFKNERIASLVVASLKMFEDCSGKQASARTARGLGEGIACLIGGEQAVSCYRESSPNRVRSLTELVMEGVVSGLVGQALDIGQSRRSWWKN